MVASDYPVTFPYGATTPPYGTTANPYHRGDDHYMPDNTEVFINGTKIGLSGHTGWVTGPHLHIGRWVNGKDTNPQGQGFNLKSPARVTDFGYDATNGNYVGINDGNGIRWVYLHLNSSSVVVGQELNGGSPPKENDMPNDGDIDNVYMQSNGRKATDSEKEAYRTKTWSAPDGIYYGKVAIDFANTQKALADAQNKPPVGFKPVGELFVKEG